MEINIHSPEFLKAVREHVQAKTVTPGLNRKWLACYLAFIAVIDRMLAVLPKPQA